MNRMGSLLISRHLTILWKRTQWRSLTSSISPEHAIPPLVSTSWLQSQLSSPSIVPIDASFAYNSLVQVDDDEIVEAPPVHDYSVDYLKGHIENARFFPFDKASDIWSPFPNKLPSKETFSEIIETLGIKREDHIVVYDSLGIKTSARLWWMLKVFGHERVSVLDGGLKKWRLEDRPLTATITESAQNLCSEVIINSDLVIELSELLDDVLGPIYAQKYRLLDARNYRDYQGQTSETEKLSGHIPTSVNYPYTRLVNPETGTLKDPQEILDFLKSKHISLDDEIVCMSETGVDAAVLFLALTVAGKTSKLRLYNGGFLEWANTRDCPIRNYY